MVKERAGRVGLEPETKAMTRDRNFEVRKKDRWPIVKTEFVNKIFYLLNLKVHATINSILEITFSPKANFQKYFFIILCTRVQI